jgi:hypothetical protein
VHKVEIFQLASSGTPHHTHVYVTFYYIEINVFNQKFGGISRNKKGEEKKKRKKNGNEFQKFF